jgi:exodeoxyribonuclease III
VTLRVLTYNVCDGGRPDRLARITDVIAAAGADIVALQELRGFTSARLDGLAASLRMRGHLARSCTGQPVGLLLGPRFSVARAGRVRRPFHHNAAYARLDTSVGRLTVLSAHLHPGSGARRLREARWLAAFAARRRPALLLGDLNTLDPWTDHTARIAGLDSRYRRRHLRRDGTVDSRAVAALADAGFVDVFLRTGAAGLDHTAPTPGPWGAEFHRMRLDYVLATEPLAGRARHCHVLDATASDHYPVLAEFAVDPA